MGIFPRDFFSSKDLTFFIKTTSSATKNDPQTREFINIMLTVHMFEHSNVTIKNKNRDKKEQLMHRRTHINITDIKGIR